MNPNISSALVTQKFKVVLLGDQAVGKTSIIKRYSEKGFNPDSDPTVGVDFVLKTIHFNNNVIKLQLWDTAGQERFRSLIPSYIKDSTMAIVVYDVTSRTSFENVEKWVSDVKDNRGDEAIIALVGNKIDLEEEIEVPTQDGVDKAKEMGLLFVETSAKTNQGITELFESLVDVIVEDNEDGEEGDNPIRPVNMDDNASGQKLNQNRVAGENPTTKGDGGGCC